MKRSMSRLTSLCAAATALAVVTGCGVVFHESSGKAGGIHAAVATGADRTKPASLGPDVPLTAANALEPHMKSPDGGWGIIRTTNSSMLVRTTNGGRTWFDVSPKGVARDPNADASFPNERSAWWAVQPQAPGGAYKPTLYVYHTNDAGRHWTTSRISLDPSVPVQSTQIDVVNRSTVYMDVIPMHGMNSMPGQLMVSHTGGAAWQKVPTPSTLPMGGAIHFVSPQQGWLSTSDCSTCPAHLYRTQDGGRVWTEIRLPSSSAFAGDQASVSLPRFSARHPLVAILPVVWQKPTGVVAHEAIYGTVNGGRTWSLHGATPLLGNLSSFVDTRVVVVLPMTGQKSFTTLRVTTDAGRKWAAVTLPKVPFQTLLPSFVPSQIEFVSSRVGWIVWVPRRGGSAKDQLWKTTDGGKTWANLSSSS